MLVSQFGYFNTTTHQPIHTHWSKIILFLRDCQSHILYTNHCGISCWSTISLLSIFIFNSPCCQLAIHLYTPVSTSFLVTWLILEDKANYNSEENILTFLVSFQTYLCINIHTFCFCFILEMVWRPTYSTFAAHSLGISGLDHVSLTQSPLKLGLYSTGSQSDQTTADRVWDQRWFGFSWSTNVGLKKCL